jgi:malonyl-CoA decarboxylase
LFQDAAAALAREGISQVGTLSPMPGFRRWLAERANARYLLEYEGKRPPTDPVARFHLGNGTEAWRFNPFADLSANGRRQSFGLMDNYRYDRDRIGDRQAAHHGNHARAASDLLCATARRP